MQRVHFQVRSVFSIVNKPWQRSLSLSFDIECRLAWHWWNSTELGLIDMFFNNVACILLFRKSRHKPNLESTSKYGFPPIWGKKWRRSEHAHASYPGLSFRPPSVRALLCTLILRSYLMERWVFRVENFFNFVIWMNNICSRLLYA